MVAGIENIASGLFNVPVTSDLDQVNMTPHI
jgi:hypothetical protein